MFTTYNIVLYILAALFGIAGFIKLKQPKQKLAKTMPWTREFKPATIKFIGFAEFSGAIGLVGPLILGFSFILINWAALGLSLIMVLAGIYHSRRNEWASLAINIMLLVSTLAITFNLLSR